MKGRKNLSSASQPFQAFSYWESLDASSAGGKQIKEVNYSVDINIFIANILIMYTSIVELHHNILLIGITGNAFFLDFLL